MLVSSISRTDGTVSKQGRLGVAQGWRRDVFSAVHEMPILHGALQYACIDIRALEFGNPSLGLKVLFQNKVILVLHKDGGGASSLSTFMRSNVPRHSTVRSSSQRTAHLDLHGFASEYFQKKSTLSF